MKQCSFEVVSTFKNENINIPKRKTVASAGYDIESAEDIVIPALSKKVVKTGLKAKMSNDLVLLIHIRSSMAFKKNLSLVNSVGVIDADYYNNEDNEGHILVGLYNNSNKDVEIKKGERIAQGIFVNYVFTENDDEQEKEIRIGGIGSTGK